MHCINIQSHSLLSLVALTHFLAPVSAIPAPSIYNPQSLFPRSQSICANAPNIAAGSNSQLSISTRRLHLTSRTPPTSPVLWCAQHSQTYLLITVSQTIVGNGLQNLLSSCFNAIISQILDHGDGVISNGVFAWPGSSATATAASGGAEGASSSGGGQQNPPDELAVLVWNANNHQVSWGVLGAAVSALSDFMEQNGWASATFEIWDGNNQVGFGLIG